MGQLSHQLQNWLEPHARPARQGLGSPIVDLWAQENRDRLEKRTTTGPIVPKQETILLSPISLIVVVVQIIGNKLAVIMNKKFKTLSWK